MSRPSRATSASGNLCGAGYPGRNLVTLKVKTGAGLAGLGDATLFLHASTFSDGMLYPSDASGHGEIDAALAARHPYRRADLSVNRLQHDGTFWNW